MSASSAKTPLGMNAKGVSGRVNTLLAFRLRLNHSKEQLAALALDHTFIFSIRVKLKGPMQPRWPLWYHFATPLLVDRLDYKNGFGDLLFLRDYRLAENEEWDGFQVGYAEGKVDEKNIKTQKGVPQYHLIYGPVSGPIVQPKNPAHPLNAYGAWQRDDLVGTTGSFATLTLWHFRLPAFFDCHLHIQSNNCAPLPLLWSRMLGLRVSADFVDTMAKWGIGVHEMGKIGRMSTEKIAGRLEKDRKKIIGTAKGLWPFLDPKAAYLYNCLPMDMDWGHFYGYMGYPIYVERKDKKGQREISFFMARHWGKGGLLQGLRDACTVTALLSASTGNFMGAGLSTTGRYFFKWLGEEYQNEKEEEAGYWFKLGTDSAKAFENFEKQTKYQTQRFNGKQFPSINFFHVEPRRYFSGKVEKGAYRVPLESIWPFFVQAGSKTDPLCRHLGVKLYTSLGYAPRDPLVWDVQKVLYRKCIDLDIPLMNHCSMEGMYTHDRAFYYDLLSQHGALENEKKNKALPFHFFPFLKNPAGAYIVPDSKVEKVHWFCENYVSPKAWKSLLEKSPEFKKLRFCLAHFTGSHHLGCRNPQRKRSDYDPFVENAKKTFSFDAETGKVDPTKTDPYIYALCDLIDEDNNAYVDLSYVLFDDENLPGFEKLIRWARKWKPILLDRILWGSDWFMIAIENQISGEGDEISPYLQNHKRFFDRVPADLLVRFAFLNPLRYFGRKNLVKMVQFSGVEMPAWLSGLEGKTSYELKDLVKDYARAQG